MPKLTIDGVELEVPQGTTLLQAALSRGQEIPHYCYHPGLSIAGNCRMCLVEVEKAPKLVIGCQTPVAEGMVVHTHNERVRKAHAAVMEFLLINHPLDCPICDQAGECKLQDYAVSCGTGVSRFTETKLRLNKAVDLGRHVMLDQERCIQCSRCIRFCDEITGTSELAFFQRGERSIIGIAPGKRLDNPYSGNVVDICPVGALTLKEFRFTNRVWYLKNTPTVCAGCSRGCNIVAAVGRQQELMTTRGQLDDRLKRLVPRVNEAVNGHWMCDEGRLSYQPLNSEPRLELAPSPAGNTVEWDEAIAQVAGKLKSAAEAGRLAVILSPRLTSETIYAWRSLLDRLGQARIAVQQIVRGRDDELLIRADKGANATGASWILGFRSTETDVIDAAASGKLQTLLVVGDPLNPADSPRLPTGVRAKLTDLICVGAFMDATTEQATHALPACAWSEEDGTLVNFEGRIQRVQRCHLPHGEARPGWRVVADLARAAGVELPDWTSAAAVLESLTADVGPYAGVTEENVGLLGRMGAAATPAGA